MTRFSLIVIALFIELASAFAPAAVPFTPQYATTTASTTTTTTTAIHLVPEQGRQLVAFSQEYHSKKAKESASKASNLTQTSRCSNNNKKSSMLGSLVTRLLLHGDEGRPHPSHQENNPRKN
mmetsp:Transcript_25907/g.49337  ORF Transcript_25907/g.49337 Transcript_25907/m.49337 type:complete len:122 (-) Transcript_25907:360-725(-)